MLLFPSTFYDGFQRFHSFHFPPLLSGVLYAVVHTIHATRLYWASVLNSQELKMGGGF
jgi:hypothetical protein